MSDAATHEPPPTEGNETVYPHVLSDIEMRVAAGNEKYKTYLQTNNGRDALWDAYQEALDLVFYLRQVILERDTD